MPLQAKCCTILCPRGKGGLEHQFIQPRHTRETGPFCNSCHMAQSTEQVYNQDLPQNLCGTASKDMGLSEQSFPTQGHPKNINNQRKKTTAELYMLFVLGANSLHHLPCAHSQSPNHLTSHLQDSCRCRWWLELTEILIRRAINSEGNKTGTLLAGSQYLSSTEKFHFLVLVSAGQLITI